MARAEIQQRVEIRLSLDLDEAEFIRDLCQNDLGDDESVSNSHMRCSIFTQLKDALDKVTPAVQLPEIPGGHPVMLKHDGIPLMCRCHNNTFYRESQTRYTCVECGRPYETTLAYYKECSI